MIGSECLQQIERRLGSSNFLHMARQIALFHHERWDGQGYPSQIAGEAIPLVARIVAVADMYDALSVKRVYKDAYPHDRCVAIIRSEAGKHLDPAIVQVFLDIEQEKRSRARRVFPRQTHRPKVWTFCRDSLDFPVPPRELPRRVPPALGELR